MLVVTNRTLVKGDFKERLETIDKANIDAIVLREKDWTREECESFIRGLNVSNKIFINNPNMLNCMYISLPFSKFEEGIHADAIVSVHSAEEAKIAGDKGAKAIIAGHVFATDCKIGLEPRGLGFLNKVCSSVKIPVFAIGGIDENNVRSVMEEGAFGVAVMSSAMKRDNVIGYLNSIYEAESIYRSK